MLSSPGPRAALQRAATQESTVAALEQSRRLATRLVEARRENAALRGQIQDLRAAMTRSCARSPAASKARTARATPESAATVGRTPLSARTSGSWRSPAGTETPGELELSVVGGVAESLEASTPRAAETRPPLVLRPRKSNPKTKRRSGKGKEAGSRGAGDAGGSAHEEVSSFERLLDEVAPKVVTTEPPSRPRLALRPIPTPPGTPLTLSPLSSPEREGGDSARRITEALPRAAGLDETRSEHGSTVARLLRHAAASRARIEVRDE